MGFLRYFRVLWVQVLVGVVLGLAVGAIWPHFGASLKPLGDAFIKLIGNGVATVVVSKWEKEFDTEQMARVMSSDKVEEELEAEATLPHGGSKPV